MDDFTAFAEAQVLPLRRSAYLLCGDWHTADDLVQTTLLKLFRAWPRINGREIMTNYVRTVLLRTWLDERARPFRRAERVSDSLPEPASPDQDRAGRMWQRTVVHQALLELPPRQRAVIVLRYFDDLDVAGAAAVLGCSTGTVKSQTARALAALRERVAALPDGDLAVREVLS